MGEKFSDKTDTSGGDAARALYGDWDRSDGAEAAKDGYATPERCARALSLIAKRDIEILDFGCGTGLSGQAFRNAGFTTIDGMDLSEPMLEQARDTKCYRTLTTLSPEAPPPIRRGAYQAIAAVGAIGVGAAPLAVFDHLFAALGPGGLLVFSFDDLTLEDGAYEARISDAFLAGDVKIRHRDYGQHLPARNMKSVVYIIEKQ